MSGSSSLWTHAKDYICQLVTADVFFTNTRLLLPLSLSTLTASHIETRVLGLLRKLYSNKRARGTVPQNQAKQGTSGPPSRGKPKGNGRKDESGAAAKGRLKGGAAPGGKAPAEKAASLKNREGSLDVVVAGSASGRERGAAGPSMAAQGAGRGLDKAAKARGATDKNPPPAASRGGKPPVKASGSTAAAKPHGKGHVIGESHIPGHLPDPDITRPNPKLQFISPANHADILIANQTFSFRFLPGSPTLSYPLPPAQVPRRRRSSSPHAPSISRPSASFSAPRRPAISTSAPRSAPRGQSSCWEPSGAPSTRLSTGESQRGHRDGWEAYM